MAAKHSDGNGVGRRDLQFFFNWLRAKGVRHIINVHVDDMTMPPHSDEAIVSALEHIRVDKLDWKKLDMDPRAILSIGKTSGLREVSLQWSGNNAVLQAWSELEGLPLLHTLSKVNVSVPSAHTVSEIRDCLPPRAV